MAQQWLAGDWPVRDFFDNGRFLQYSLSALAQLTIGDRLLGEALIAGLAWAISTYLVFVLVRRLTDSLPAAFLASLLLIVAGARGYSYPKGIVYAVAAVLWWAYVRRPSVQTIVAFGAWVAAAYYWRPDHGVFAAFGLVLAAVTAHGFRRETVTRVALAAATTLALVDSLLDLRPRDRGAGRSTCGQLWRRSARSTRHMASMSGRSCGSAGVCSWRSPQSGTHRSCSVRWSAGSDPAARQAIRERYGLTSVEVDGDSERRPAGHHGPSPMSPPSFVSRSSKTPPGSIDPRARSKNPAGRRAAQEFEHAWLRLQVLPDLDDRERAAEYAVVLFLLLPLVLLIRVPGLRHAWRPDVTPWQLSAFALFAFAGGVRDVAAALHCPRRRCRRPLCRRVRALCTVWLWRTESWRERAGDRVQSCGCRTCACDDDERGSLRAVRSDPRQPDPTLDDEPDRRRVGRRAP